jgi:hypothetical protein
MRATVQVKLPDAPPDTYLAWVDWWRTVERVIDRLERTATEGRAQGPRLLHGAVPGYLSRVFLEEIRRQAHHAKRCGNETVGPVVRADPRLLWDAAGVLESQARWMEGWLEDGVVSARLGLGFPGWRVELLRGHVVDGIREQVRRQVQETATSVRTRGNARRRGELILTVVETGDPHDALVVQTG